MDRTVEDFKTNIANDEFFFQELGEGQLVQILGLYHVVNRRRSYN